MHNIVIHVAGIDDLLDLYNLVDVYSDEIQIDKNRAKLSIREMVYMDSTMLFEYRGLIVGAIAGYTMPGTFTDSVIFSAMFFYMLPEYRYLTKHVIKEIELVLLPTKVNKIVFSVPANGKAPLMRRFWKMLGYKELEIHMCKRI